MTDAATPAAATAKSSWLPMGVILLAQMQMAFNVNALPISIGPIVESLDVASTTVGTALVVYSLVVAAFVLVGAKLGKLIGERLVFQVTVVLHGAAMALMAFSPSAGVMILSQALAGLAAAALVPTLVVLIAANYQGKQQEQALGLLAGAPAMAGVLAFFLAGAFGTLLSWRLSFAILAVVAVGVLLLSFRLSSVKRQPEVTIDLVGAALAALSIILISFGFNNLNSWGALLASPTAPFNLAGLSPAPFMILAGLVGVQLFFVWSHRRVGAKKSPLMSLEVIDSKEERSAIVALLVIGGLGPAVNFLIPLYIQIVQGQTSLQTSVSVIPYTVAIFSAAVLIVRLYGRFAPREIGTVGFLIVSVGLTLLAFTIQNDWGTLAVIFGLIVLGLGEGALLTLLFNVLVSASPKRLAGDVGALRGVANNLATAVGTAVAGALSVGVLAYLISVNVEEIAVLPPPIQEQIELDNVDFISNDHLEDVLEQYSTPSAVVDEIVDINAKARLQALKATLLVLAGVALLAVVPSRGLPPYRPGEVPVERETTRRRLPRAKPRSVREAGKDGAAPPLSELA